jgi:hypothetical protein
MTVAAEWAVNAGQAITQLDGVAVTAGQAAVIARAHAVHARATERAWVTGGIRVVYAMALLEAALDADRDSLAVLIVEAATENLLLVITRECGQDEARYVTEGDE